MSSSENPSTLLVESSDVFTSPKNKPGIFARTLKSKPAMFAAASLFAAGAAAFYYARRIEPKNYKLETVRIITGDGNAWRAREGNGKRSGVEERVERRLFRILHISDLHLSKPESHKIDFIRKITDADFDLIILTGDVFEDLSGIEYAENLLSRRPRLGAYAVLGNHDYYDYNMFHKTVGRIIKPFRHPREKRDVKPFVEALQNGGFDVLRNESRCLKEHGLHIVGIDYPGIKEPELARLADQAPAHHLKLCVFHTPKKLHFITNAGFQLALGGHTHGGQVRIPGFGPLITDSELSRHEASGLIRRGDTAFHISRGLGADPRSNIRFFCPPAATIVEVHHQMPRTV
ncbi:MAG: metallophosphoesterase [Candidatus Melainabacteria bacterium]|nr:metallophosphoesterase [Candidatus Melainabacteria bacterium]